MIQSTYDIANAAIKNDPNVLKDIHLASKNIAIYQRDIEPLSADLEQIADYEIKYHASGSVAEILSQLDDFFTNHLEKCPSLFDDISEILGLFEQTTQKSSFRLLLETVSTNMCRKFHTDVNDLRLLCTYIGPGTLWMPDGAIDQKASKASKEMVMDFAQKQQVAAGDVVMLKGALYPDANPILHRSPTIEEKGEKRLLLRIDTNETLTYFS